MMNAARGARGVNEGTRRGEEGLRLRLSLESVRCALVLRNSYNDARRKAGTPPGRGRSLRPTLGPVRYG